MAAKKRAAKRTGKAAKTAPARALDLVIPATLERVRIEPLRAEAAAALARGEEVRLLAGRDEGGGRVETLVFGPLAKGAQSSGTYVHRGDWSGERLVTDRGHVLDLDGNCFCRDCETAGGYTIDDDE